MTCIFCKIIKGELPTTKVYEDDEMIVFKDIAPKAPVHVLVVPKIHFASLNEAKEEKEKLLGKLLLKTRDIAKTLGISKSGYKVIINNGAGSGQVVFHLHLHLIGGWKEGAKGYIV
ncbi:histidine triad nucleotide-binding protein [Candidatus Gottesmanbacteria bacterium]|nr:histidine triad nucleotide-binding protein [Candidatus Gottesmanbacteria bacterium]